MKQLLTLVRHTLMNVGRVWDNRYARCIIVTVVALFASYCACNAAEYNNHEHVRYLPIVTHLVRICIFLMSYCIVLLLMGLMCMVLSGVVSKIIYMCHKKNK